MDLNVAILRTEKNLIVGFKCSDFEENPEPYVTCENVLKFILSIESNNNVIRSNFNLDDIEVLKNVFQVTKKTQIKRANEFVKIALKILEIQKNNKFIHECYFLKKEKGEVVLCKNSEYKEELMRINIIGNQWKILRLMRINIIGNQWKILRSSLSEKCLTDFQKILLDLLI